MATQTLNPTEGAIAILLATYNGAKYLTELLDSILLQTYANWILLVRDDCSQDGTRTILARYESADSRINVDYGTEQLGPMGNFECLSKRASDYQYIMYCDQDDYWDSQKVEITYKRMLEVEKDAGRGTPILVFCGKRVVDDNLSPLSCETEGMTERLHLRNLLIQNPIYGCTMMVNCVLLKQAVPFPTYAIMHDYIFALLAATYGVISYIPTPLISYRQHSGNVTGGSRNFSILAKLRDLSKTNRKVAKAMWQNYYFSIDHIDAQKEVLSEFVHAIDTNRFWRIVLMRDFVPPSFSVMQRMRMYVVLFLINRDMI